VVTDFGAFDFPHAVAIQGDGKLVATFERPVEDHRGVAVEDFDPAAAIASMLDFYVST
jgi:hypothetical protein